MASLERGRLSRGLPFLFLRARRGRANVIDYVSFGEELTEAERADSAEVVAAVARACAAGAAFKLLERRRWASPYTGECDVLVVDCVNDQVPTRNASGVWSRERLALVLPRDPSKPPQVRALRRDFPRVMHLNLVARGEPASLCLYSEPWADSRRTWTAERFLQRILLWLADTANGTLHRSDQPVEAIYFESSTDVVLPPHWEEQLNDAGNLLLLGLIQGDAQRVTFRALVAPRPSVDSRRIAETVAIRVCVDAIVHGAIEALPSSLGELSDGLTDRGSRLLEPLRAEVARLVGSAGAAPVDRQNCLLLLSFPTKRSASDDVERVDPRGFRVLHDLATLGVKIGALTEFATGGNHYPATILGGGGAPSSGTAWRDIPLVPVAIRYSATRESSRAASAVPEGGADKKRVLAGVGALGSQLADLWSREGWGTWTLVDPDFVQPHNVVRHLARDVHVGYDKVVVVKDLLDAIRPLERKACTAFRGDVLTTSNAKFVEDRKQASLIVDATTTFEVPRELSRRDDVARCVSVFLTPSGSGSVLLLEDESRDVRLDELEAQYYGAILAHEWGKDHLAGHRGELWVGAGCRDVSFVLSNELVQLHASVLARQVRLSSALPPARIRIWITDAATSAVRMVEVPVQPPLREERHPWTVISHAGIRDKLKALRSEKLPAETGGVIVGYIDQPLRRVFIVDVLPAPPDSDGTTTGFVRGTDGLVGKLADIRDRTAGIVGYVGEWHSHPPFHPPRPSGDDVSLLVHCATTLARDGVPALMIIVGRAGEISYSLGAQADPSQANG